MSKYIEASLVLTFSIAITLLIMVVVFPVHALGGANSAAMIGGVQPAVYVEGARSCPATGNTMEERPILAHVRCGERFVAPVPNKKLDEHENVAPNFPKKRSSSMSRVRSHD